MKLKQLLEARYAGEHPVVNDIRNAFKQDQVEFKFWDLETKYVKGIVKSLIAMYGEPRVGDVGNPAGNVYHWEPVINDKRYGITIGHDNSEDPPYGIEIYYIGEPKPKRRSRR